MRNLFLLIILIASVSANAQNNGVAGKKITAAEFAKQAADYESVQKGLKLLDAQRIELEQKLKQHDSTLKAVKAKMNQWESQANAAIGAAAGGSSEDQLLNATKSMQETQMSFNLQYLQLQSQMQHENRSYTAISNIMKTKHDTVKNSISNVR